MAMIRFLITIPILKNGPVMISILAIFEKWLVTIST